jgi:DNA (cytosine-5)-methyltransferase 1
MLNLHLADFSKPERALYKKVRSEGKCRGCGVVRSKHRVLSIGWNVLSLFSGVGGIDLGLERAGMRVIAQCERDAACRRILAQHWSGVPCHEDVTGLNAEWLRGNGIHTKPEGRGTGLGRDSGSSGGGTGNAPADLPIDLVCGGFPCQDLSVAGQRKGFDGKRSVLFYEAARIADLVLGDGGWLLIENVPGLFSSNGGRDFAAVLAALAELGFHDLAWRVLDSRYFGVPQRRRRVFILARRSRGDRARQVLLEPESGGGDFEAVTKARARASSGVARRPDDPVSAVQGGGKRGYRVGAEAAAGGQLLTAKCLTTSQERQDFDTQDFVHPGLRSPEPGVRRLTPTECERLQGFPDQWTVLGESDEPNPKPDGPRYAQMGNAVSVPVAEWIGCRIVEYGGDEC